MTRVSVVNLCKTRELSRPEVLNFLCCLRASKCKVVYINGGHYGQCHG